MVLALCVTVHIATMIYAVRGGLSAAEIFTRTHGSILAATFYTLFVVAVAVHAPIGLRTVLAEWTPVRGRAADVVAVAFAVLLAGAGLRAVYGLVAA